MLDLNIYYTTSFYFHALKQVKKNIQKNINGLGQGSNKHPFMLSIFFVYEKLCDSFLEVNYSTNDLFVTLIGVAL